MPGTTYATPFVAFLSRLYKDDEAAGPLRAELAAFSMRAGSSSDAVDLEALKALGAYADRRRVERKAEEREAIRAFFAEHYRGSGRDVDEEIAQAKRVSRAILMAAERASGPVSGDAEEPADQTARKILKAHRKAHSTDAKAPLDDTVRSILAADAKRRGEIR